MSTGRNYGWGQSPVKSALKNRVRKGEIGDRTTECYIRAFKNFAQYMRTEHRIYDIGRYEEKHLEQFAQSVAHDYTASTFQKQISAINSLMRTITYGEWQSVSPSKTTRSQRRNVRVDPHLYLEPEAIVEALREHLSPQAHAVIGLIAHFGIRLEEAASLDVVAALKEHSATGTIDIIYGTKGGRGRECERLLPVNDAAYNWLRYCRKLTGPMFSLIPKGMKREAFKKMVKHEALPALNERYGLGIHGLRHEYAARRYRELTGHHTPVNCIAFGHPLADRDLDRMAREIISHELGHGRVQIVSVYIGSYRVQQR